VHFQRGHAGTLPRDAEKLNLHGLVAHSPCEPERAR
jgi:hypothetical protein